MSLTPLSYFFLSFLAIFGIIDVSFVKADGFPHD